MAREVHKSNQKSFFLLNGFKMEEQFFCFKFIKAINPLHLPRYLRNEIHAGPCDDPSLQAMKYLRQLG